LIGKQIEHQIEKIRGQGIMAPTNNKQEDRNFDSSTMSESPSLQHVPVSLMKGRGKMINGGRATSPPPSSSKIVPPVVETVTKSRSSDGDLVISGHIPKKVRPEKGDGNAFEQSKKKDKAITSAKVKKSTGKATATNTDEYIKTKRSKSSSNNTNSMGSFDRPISLIDDDGLFVQEYYGDDDDDEENFVTVDLGQRAAKASNSKEYPNRYSLYDIPSTEGDALFVTGGKKVGNVDKSKRFNASSKPMPSASRIRLIEQHSGKLLRTFSDRINSTSSNGKNAKNNPSNTFSKRSSLFTRGKNGKYNDDVNLYDTDFNDHSSASSSVEAKDRYLFAPPEPTYNNTHNIDRKRKYRKWAALAVVSAILIGAIVAVSMLVINNRHLSKMTGSTSDEKLNTQQKSISDIITDNAVVNLQSLHDPQASQFKARKWMLFEDKLFFKSMAPTKEFVIQRFALATLYFATQSDSSTWAMNSWLQGFECEKENVWVGLSCNEQHQVVTISFSDFGMVGSLPDEIGHLAMLQSLVIKNHTGLKGPIPASLGKLIGLQQLSLANNNLAGSIPYELFRSDSQLRYINVQNNVLQGTIPSDLAGVTNLEVFIASNNTISGIIPFDALAKTRIEYLALDSNKFTGPIPTSIGSCKYLKFLYLNNNELNDATIPTEIGTLQTLESINLDNTGLSGKIPSSIGYVSGLVYLSMQSNELSGQIPQEINSLIKLETLLLSSNKFGGVLPIMSSFTSLKNLVLGGNQIKGKIMDGLIKLTNLGTYLQYLP
jgi:Leucine-rich repeat (LRR) protein